MLRGGTRNVMVALAALGLAFGCGPVNPNSGNNTGGNQNQGNTNWNWNSNQFGPDAGPQDFVTFEGTVWSPGADLASTLEENRFPIPGALVAAYPQAPPDLPQALYCNECVEIPSSIVNTLSDKVDGTFSLQLIPGQMYHIVVQKGEFRRVRQIQMPDTPGQSFTLEVPAGQPRPIMTTLPVRTDLANGDNIPKIAMIDGQYESQQIMFESLGFNWATEIDLYGFGQVQGLLENQSQLYQYNLIIAPCGGEYPMSATATANLRQWVKDGGKLYVDDFNYDFVEQAWPEFLTFYSDGSVCGGGSSPPGSQGVCNNWSSYSFNGLPGDPDFDAWIRLPNVNGTNPIYLEGAWDYIYQMDLGEVGIDDECLSNCGPNGEVYSLPKVWMYNADGTSFDPQPPATVSWPFYCGRVLYTVYHTHSGGGGGSYQLLLQEKIMMYLIMEVQTCSAPPIVQ